MQAKVNVTMCWCCVGSVIEYKKHILTSILFVLIALCPSFSFAQSTSITNGLMYIESTQSPDGYWGDVSEVPYNSFVDTCAVVETLNYLNESETAYNSAIQWINSTEVFNDDYLFTKMSVLAQAGYDVSTIRDNLLSVRNDDGAWGVVEGFESDIKRTTLALQALKSINHPDLETISYALGYLTDTQNEDGGWGFSSSTRTSSEPQSNSSGSTVYMTALVLKVLSSYNRTFDLQTEIGSAVAYLLTMQNPDGGFPSAGSGQGPSTVYETALSLISLIESGQGESQPLQDAINYLQTTQQANGSWNNDPYSTALALRALASLKPNLTLTPEDITFSNPAPSERDTITITAVIHNTGPATAENVLIEIYDRDPIAGITGKKCHDLQNVSLFLPKNSLSMHQYHLNSSS